MGEWYIGNLQWFVLKDVVATAADVDVFGAVDAADTVGAV